MSELDKVTGSIDALGKALAELNGQMIQFGLSAITAIALASDTGLIKRIILRYGFIRKSSLPLPRKIAVAITGRFLGEREG